MTTLAPPKTSMTSEAVDEIHWKQLWSLAALYASVVIGWIAYQNYQPRLLTQFRFTEFTFPLMVAQGLIIAITPLVAGKIGDRFRFTQGHRLPIISSGISLAAMIFMAVAFTLLADPHELFRWALPLLIVFWLIAMSLFTSPALSTLELFTPVEKLPYAMAVITITGNLVYSLEPVIVELVDYLGAPVTFMAGGVAVFFSGWALKRNSLALFKLKGDREPVSSQRQTRSSHGLIFLMGLAAGASTMVLFYFLPEVVISNGGAIVSGVQNNVVVAWCLFLSALISWPISRVVSRHGIARIFGFSCVLLVAATAGVWLSTGMMTAMVTVLFIVAFTALSISALPLAMSRAAQQEKVFCVGIFFSGVALPEGICEAILSLP